jgi:hypothetical protein
MRRHRRRRIILNFVTVAFVLVLGVGAVALQMQNAGFKSVSSQINRLAKTNIEAINIGLEGSFRQQNLAVQAIAGPLRRGLIEPLGGAGHALTDHMLLSVLDMFNVSAVFAMTSTGTLWAGRVDSHSRSWISHNNGTATGGGCTRSWRETTVALGLRARSGSAVNSEACNFYAASTPWFRSASLSMPGGVLPQPHYSPHKYLRDGSSECTPYSCLGVSSYLGVSTKLVGSDGTPWVSGDCLINTHCMIRKSGRASGTPRCRSYRGRCLGCGRRGDERRTTQHTAGTVTYCALRR